MSAAVGFLWFAAGCGLHALVTLIVAVLEARANRRDWAKLNERTPHDHP